MNAIAKAERLAEVKERFEVYITAPPQSHPFDEAMREWDIFESEDIPWLLKNVHIPKPRRRRGKRQAPARQGGLAEFLRREELLYGRKFHQKLEGQKRSTCINDVLWNERMVEILSREDQTLSDEARDLMGVENWRCGRIEVSAHARARQILNKIKGA